MYSSLAIVSLATLSAAQAVNVYNAKSEGLSQHTIYMPKTEGKVPVMVWSSGGCFRDGGAQHAPALKEASSHGVMIIAMGTLGGGKGGGFPGMGGKGGKGGKGGLPGAKGDFSDLSWLNDLSDDEESRISGLTRRQFPGKDGAGGFPGKGPGGFPGKDGGGFPGKGPGGFPGKDGGGFPGKGPGGFPGKDGGGFPGKGPGGFPGKGPGGFPGGPGGFPGKDGGGGFPGKGPGGFPGKDGAGGFPGKGGPGGFPGKGGAGGFPGGPGGGGFPGKGGAGGFPGKGGDGGFPGGFSKPGSQVKSLINGEPAAAEVLSRRQMGSMGSDTKLMEEAFAWIEKNAGQGKFANVDKTRVAVAGQSCGGLESYNVAKNPLVKVIGIFNSGMFSSSPIVRGMKKPIFYFLGGSSDIAYNNGERDYKELPTDTPTWKGNLPVGHMATYMQDKGGKFGVAMWKWLDWNLRGNVESSKFFTGEGAGTAKGDGWSTVSRNLNKISVTPIG